MPTPAAVLASLLRSDSARPRVTCYDDTRGPTQGERVELSGRVLANWVAKAANALQEEYDAGPGTVVRLALPPLHWRTLYWALATWSVGATVLAVPGSASDVLVTDDASSLETAEGTVLVTLAALARAHPGPGSVPAGAMDEARELATYGDQFTAWAEPEPADTALIGRTTYSYAALVADRGWPPGTRVNLAGTFAHDLEGVLTAALAAWAVDGSVVLQRGGYQGRGDSGSQGSGDQSRDERNPAKAAAERRLSAEGVTLDLA